LARQRVRIRGRLVCDHRLRHSESLGQHRGHGPAVAAPAPEQPSAALLAEDQRPFASTFGDEQLWIKAPARVIEGVDPTTALKSA
jgi:hypothetical protein